MGSNPIPLIKRGNSEADPYGGKEVKDVVHQAPLYHKMRKPWCREVK